MNSKFIIAVRKAISNLPPSPEAIDRISSLQYKLLGKIEEAILKIENTGRLFLESTFKELQAEKEYVDLKVRLHLEKLREEGQDEYHPDFSNTKLLATGLEDSLNLLRKLQRTYFEEPGKSNTERNKIIVQKAEKIYNINHIDKADFS